MTDIYLDRTAHFRNRKHMHPKRQALMCFVVDDEISWRNAQELYKTIKLECAKIDRARNIDKNYGRIYKAWERSKTESEAIHGTR